MGDGQCILVDIYFDAADFSSDSNYLLWKCNSRLIRKTHHVDSAASSIPFDQLNVQIEYYLSMVDNQIKQKLQGLEQTDSSSEEGDDYDISAFTVIADYIFPGN